MKPKTVPFHDSDIGEFQADYDRLTALGYSACWSHYVFEHVGRLTHRVCGECGHVWTARKLRRADARVHRELESQWQKWGSRHRIRYRHRLARHIYSCPECVHDF